MTSAYVLVAGAVDLVKARHRNTARVGLSIRNELNEKLLALGWPNGAPFDVVSLILRFGEEALPGVNFEPVKRVRGVRMLPIAVHLSIGPVVEAQASDDRIASILRPRMVEAVNAVGERYGLPGLAT